MIQRTEEQTSGRVQIFHPYLEKFYFALIAVFVTLLLLVHLDLVSISVLDPTGWELIVCYIFMNTSHTIVTLIMLMFMPEFKDWFRQKIRTKWAFGFLGVSSLILYFCYIFAFKIHLNQYLIGLGILITGGLAIIHPAAQTKGLSLLYNNLNKKNLNDAEIAQQHKQEKIERALFFFLVMTILTKFIFRKVLNFDMQNLSWIFNTLAAFLVLAIFINCFFYPKIKKSNKPFFLVSTTFLAFNNFSAAAALMNKALHGTEYMLYSYSVLKRSRRKWTAVIVTSAISFFLFLALVTYLFNPKYDFVKTINLSDSWKLGILFGVNCLEFFHYYLDSQLFKFSDPAVRQNLQSVLLSDQHNGK